MARKPTARPRQAKPKRSNSEAQEIEDLEQRLAQLDPIVASADGQEGQGDMKNFEDLPLSRHTIYGLKKAKYIEMTAIQKAALPHALTGQDVLGAAKTGSGKTLAFTIPVLEKLYRLKWGRLDGLGALIISPTRELAMQIFEELRKVGQRHDLSAGLLIGGKNVKEEQDRVNGMNILVATPGRLLQHMDETPGFDCSDLQVLVLDEADRILDMGFSGTLNAILQNVPVRRQTMLFSATQTKRVKDLVRLSLHDPTYIAIHAQSAAPTPVKLQQAYVICELQNKMSILWAFVKSHLKAKVLVFLSTCKQVKYVYEVLRRLRPGVPLRCIHGKMKQMKRMAAIVDFTEDKGGSVLFATDVAGRGLDFPNVDWVVQMDCPEDLDSYIHRAGRTARFKSAGKSLLMLLPSEKEGMLQLLEERNIPIKPLKINPNKTQPIGPALQAMLSKNNELKELAQAALKSYLRSVFLQPNKAIFNVGALPAADYAASLGLASVPQMRFLKRAGMQAAAAARSAPAGASAPRQAEDRLEEDDEVDVTSDDEDADVDDVDVSEKDDGAAEARRGSGAAAGTSAAAGTGVAGAQAPVAGERHDGSVGSGSSDEDDLLVVKRRNIHDVELLPEQPANGTDPGVAKRKKKKALKIKVGKTTGSRVVFDEEGHAVEPLAQLGLPGSNGGAGEEEEEVTAKQRFARLREELKARDAADREAYRERRRQRAQAKKERARARDAAEAAADAGGAPRLAGAPPSDGELSASGDEEGASSGEEQQERHMQTYDDADNNEGVSGLDSDEDGRDMQLGGRKRGRAGAAGDAPRKRLAPEPAHMDMAPAPQLGIGDLSIAQQEALALSMLSRKR